MTDLKPCPVCKGEHFRVAVEGVNWKRDNRAIQCNTAGCAMVGPVACCVEHAREKWNALPRQADLEALKREAVATIGDLLDALKGYEDEAPNAVAFARAFIERNKEGK